MSKQYYGDLQFDSSFIFALTSTGKKIKFSKLERALLLAFTSQPNQLLTRAMLLEHLRPDDPEALDRNIDYLLSRLRRKLGDSSKAPKYIATQYGEGYLWIAKPLPSPETISNNIFLSIGPLYGLKQASSHSDYAINFTRDLLLELKAQLNPHGDIAFCPDDPEQQAAHHKAQYHLEISFISSNRRSSCNMVLLNRTTGVVFGSFKHLFSNDIDGRDLSHLAQAINNSIS